MNFNIILLYVALLLLSSLICELAVKIEVVDLETRQQLAEELYVQGITYAEQEDMDKALSLLRGACRLYNGSALFWNDLGVTELRTNQPRIAKMRFYRALKIDPSFSTAQDNLAELQGYLSPNDLSYGSKSHYHQFHKLSNVYELSAREALSLDHLYEDKAMLFRTFLLKTLLKDSINEEVAEPDPIGLLEKPFILRGAASKWGWDLSKLTSDYLSDNYGDISVDYYPHNMVEENVHPFFTNLHDAVKNLEYPIGIGLYRNVDVSLPGTYAQWNMDEDTWRKVLLDANVTHTNFPSALDDRHWSSECFNTVAQMNDFNIKTHWKMILIGQKMAGMFNHKDVLRAASWQVQVEGRKRWHFCSSVDDKNMYKPGEVDTFNPDYKSFPRFRSVKTCSQAIVYAGDLVYYPRDYWHQTENLDTPSTALSSSVVTPNSFAEVAEELRKDCNENTEGKRILPFERETCDQIQNSCFKAWTDVFQNPTSSPKDSLKSSERKKSKKVSKSSKPSSEVGTLFEL